MTRRPIALVFAIIAVPFALVACSEKGDPNKALESAGGLPESRLPVGPRGDSPPPTAAIPRDKDLEKGWYKRAQTGDKAPSAGDRPSL